MSMTTRAIAIMLSAVAVDGKCVTKCNKDDKSCAATSGWVPSDNCSGCAPDDFKTCYTAACGAAGVDVKCPTLTSAQAAEGTCQQVAAKCGGGKGPTPPPAPAPSEKCPTSCKEGEPCVATATGWPNAVEKGCNCGTDDKFWDCYHSSCQARDPTWLKDCPKMDFKAVSSHNYGNCIDVSKACSSSKASLTVMV